MTSLFCLTAWGRSWLVSVRRVGRRCWLSLPHEVFQLMLLSVHGALRSAGL